MEICSPVNILCDAPTNTKISNKKSKIKMESTTIYKSSYLNHNKQFHHHPALPFKYGKSLSKVSAKIDFNTVHKLSYKKLKRVPVKPIIPKSRLAFAGPREKSTTYTNSYADYTFAKTFPYKPHAGKICNPAPMYLETVMKKSYSHPGKTEKTCSSTQRKFWQTSFKTDYTSVNHFSYSDPKVFPRKARHRTQRHPVPVKMDCDTTYRMSYQIPRHVIVNVKQSC